MPDLGPMQRSTPGRKFAGGRRNACVAVDSNGDSSGPGRGRRPAAARGQSSEVTDADGYRCTRPAVLVSEASPWSADLLPLCDDEVDGTPRLEEKCGEAGRSRPCRGLNRYDFPGLKLKLKR